jgi:hypothetical protein
MSALLLIFTLFIPLATSPVTTQPATIVVTVVDSLAHYPLANADILDLNTGQRRFTDDQGQARIVWPTNGQLRLRVRQVGYQPRERTIRQGVEGAAATFEMTKVAYVLSTVRATSRCSTVGDTAAHDLSYNVLDQLKQGAEKYNQFRNQYPFELTVERRMAAVPTDSSEQPKIYATLEKFQSDRFEGRYKPGDIIEYKRGSFYVPILFLSTLADSVFWENHCFVASGGQSYHGEPVLALDFSPRSGLDEPDYAGTAYLDSATSYLRRVDFHLTNLHDRRGPRRLEGFITFTSPSPYVVVPDTTVAIWWVRRIQNDNWGKPDYVQRLNLQQLKYRKATPPNQRTEPPH